MRIFIAHTREIRYKWSIRHRGEYSQAVIRIPSNRSMSGRFVVRGVKPMLNVRRVVFVAVLISLVILLFGCGSTRTYTVQAGDTLSGIAQKNNTTVAALVEANADRYPSLTTKPQKIPVGWRLDIPARDDAAVRIEALIMEITRATNPPDAPAPAAATSSTDKANQIVQGIQDGINAARAEKNLPPLTMDANLQYIAQARSNDMIARSFFSHTDPRNGRILFQDLLDNQKYPYLFAGENIAEIRNQGAFVPPSFTVYARYSAPDLAQQFVTGWINSPDHYENIINPHFSRTGIAIAVSADGTRVVATQVFSD